MTFENSFKKIYVTRQNLMLLALRVISLLNSIVVWWIIPLQDVVKYERTHLWQLIHASLLNTGVPPVLSLVLSRRYPLPGSTGVPLPLDQTEDNIFMVTCPFWEYYIPIPWNFHWSHVLSEGYPSDWSQSQARGCSLGYPQARTGWGTHPPLRQVMFGQVTAWAVRLLQFPTGRLSCYRLHPKDDGK